jgi:MFS family permease
VRAGARVEESLRAFAAVFANPSLRDLQLGATGATIGTWAYAVALPVYAYHAGGARAVGLLFFARFVLAALASPWVGLLADRWSRRQLMLWADIVRFVIFAGITALAALDAPAVPLFVLAVSSTIVSSSFDPARKALMPSLAETPEQLTAANVVGNAVASTGMFLGPALGGVLLALSGPTVVFGFNALTFVWSAFWVAKVPRDRPPEGGGERPGMVADLVEGFATVARRPALRVVIGITAAQTVVVGAFDVLVVVLALRVLDTGNAGVGWLNAVLGVGSLLGALVVTGVARRRRLATAFGVGALLWGVPIALAGLWPNFAFALVLMAVLGLGDVVFEVTSLTLLQRSADREVLGRVFGILQSIVLAGLALGSVAAPGLVSWLGPRSALVVAGAFLPALLVPLWPRLLAIDAAAQIAEEPLELLRGIPIFAPLPEPVLERLASGAAAVAVPAGGTVLWQGERGDRFYAIAEGRAAVVVDDGTTRELGPGGFFGEIALLRDVPRTATVRSLDDLRLYSLEREDFIAAVTGHASSLEAAESIVSARLPVGAAP